jgi:hypothetical protein
MQPFKKMIYMLRTDETSLPVLSFYFEGIYEYPDEVHSEGGTVVFVNEWDDTITLSGFWAGFCMEISAKTIISHVGAVPCTP